MSNSQRHDSGYHGSPVEEVLPVTISPHDDRVEAPQGAGPKVAMRNHAIVAGLGGRWPALLGYNRLTAKPGADVVATVDGDPLIVAGTLDPCHAPAAPAATARREGLSPDSCGRSAPRPLPPMQQHPGLGLGSRPGRDAA